MELRKRQRGEAVRRPGRCAAAAGTLVALLFGLPLLSCGGDSSRSVAPPGVCIDFAPAAAPASGTVVLAEGDATTCDRLALDLIITDVNDVFGAEFRLGFDPAVLRYIGHSESGSVLASDGTSVAVFSNELGGVLQLSIVRLGAAAGGIDVAGSQLLIRLSFARETDSGASSLDFSGERIWNSALPPEQIGGVVWHGATVAIR
jgi:hypothetical protein